MLPEAYPDWVKEANEADDGALRYRGEYLVSVA
jgi:hypothetical protein